MIEKIKALFKKEEPKPEAEPPAPQVQMFAVNLPALVCQSLETLLSGAEWHIRMTDTTDFPNYILKIYPKVHDDGWEPVVSMASSSGAIKEITFVELLTYFAPYAPSDKGFQA